MNAQRRQTLRLALDHLRIAAPLIEEAAEGEREYADSIPDNMVGGAKWDEASDLADALENGVEALGELIGAIIDVVE